MSLLPWNDLKDRVRSLETALKRMEAELATVRTVSEQAQLRAEEMHDVALRAVKRHAQRERREAKEDDQGNGVDHTTERVLMRRRGGHAVP